MGIVDLRDDVSALFRHPVDSLHLHLPRAALDDLAADTGASPIAGLRGGDWTQDDRTVRQLCPILLEAIENPGHVTKPFVDHMIMALTAHIAAAYGGMQPRQVQRGSLAPWQVNRAKEMLAADLAKDVGLIGVAMACGLSLSYFSRAFRVSTGATPHGWFQAHRIEQARILLGDAELPLADIALRCGFADQSHFTRVFKQATGHGPGAWRRLRNLP